MGQRVKVELFDDLNPETDATTTVTFSYKGDTYEIDLSDRNLAAMDRAFDKYVRAARKIRSGTKGKRKAGKGPTSAEVREWAIEQGMEVSPFGKVPSEIMDRYREAHAA